MRLFPTNVETIHFIGIGGIGMSGIAEILNNVGYKIQGSDLQRSSITSRLERIGVKISFGHSATNVHNASVVVISASINQDNVELQEARRLKIPVIKRAEMLGELMRLKKAIAIAGTHGKTSTTSLAANLLDCHNLSPTVVNGGVINAYGSNARLGSGSWIIVEADESDGSFEKLFPTIAVVTNIDRDHLQNFKDFGELKDRFINFIEKIPFYGVAIVCNDDPIIREQVIPQITDKRILTYGLSAEADIVAKNISLQNGTAKFDVSFSQSCIDKYEISSPEHWVNLHLQMVGLHNVLNALSVIGIAIEMNIPLDDVRNCFATFSGVNRRFTHIGTFNDVPFIDDYAHHPTEIEAVLKAARTVSNGKIFAIIQPHRYSRLESLFEEFAQSMLHCDSAYILPVYSAGEPLGSVDSPHLAKKCSEIGHMNVTYCPCIDTLKKNILESVTPGDIVIFMGAGDITYKARSFVSELEQEKT